MFQVSKSFLEPLGVNNDSKALALLIEEFIDGYKQDTNTLMSRSQEDFNKIDALSANLEKFYNWNKRNAITQMATQKCSDMIVYVCKYLKIVLSQLPTVQ